MGFGEVIVAIVLIVMVGEVMKERAKSGRTGGNLKVLLNEIRDLKDQVRQLRQQNTDVILHLDNTVQRLDRRVDHLESHASLPSGEEQSRRAS